MIITYDALAFGKGRKPRQLGPLPSRSFVKQFLQLFYSDMSNLSLSVLDTGGTGRTVQATTSLGDVLSIEHCGLDAMDDCSRFNSNVSLTSQTFGLAGAKGIVVGTGSTAVAVTDTALAAQIAHGTSAGQFVHYGTWGHTLSTGSSPATFKIERIFKNSSGGSIVVAEFGIYASAYTNTSPQIHYFCIVRDVPAATITVLNGEFLRVTYTFQVAI